MTKPKFFTVTYAPRVQFDAYGRKKRPTLDCKREIEICADEYREVVKAFNKMGLGHILSVCSYEPKY